MKLVYVNDTNYLPGFTQTAFYTSTMTNFPLKEMYRKTLETLYTRNRGLTADGRVVAVKQGLDNISRLASVLDIPLDKGNVVHVAGTNGKGSVCWKLAHEVRLVYPAKNVGLFTSPHLSSFRERIRINGELVSEDQVSCVVVSLRSSRI